MAEEENLVEQIRENAVTELLERFPDLTPENHRASQLIREIAENYVPGDTGLLCRLVAATYNGHPYYLFHHSYEEHGGLLDCETPGAAIIYAVQEFLEEELFNALKERYDQAIAEQEEREE